MSCRATREWLHRDAQSLDEAQRLQLDDHLAACTDCRGDRARLRLVREVGTELPVPPAGAREYSRAIARAFLEGTPAREERAPRRLRFAWLVPLAIGGVAAAAVATAVVMRDEPKPVVKPAPAVDNPIVDKPIVDKPVDTPIVDEPVVDDAIEIEPQETRKTKPAKVPSLADARKQLDAGQHADAERTTEALLARSLTRAEEAEARMFHADLAQAMGDLGTAAERYEAVATKFSDLPAAESALYAAARIETRRGREHAARTLYDRYLASYPNGRYADDVRRQRRPK